MRCCGLIWTPHKQRHTITRICLRLIDEQQMRDVSYPLVRAYLAEHQPQIRAEADHGTPEVLWRSHTGLAPRLRLISAMSGRLGGELVSCSPFCLRLSFSGNAVHRVSISGGQEAFFEGHEHAFRMLGGVP